MAKEKKETKSEIINETDTKTVVTVEKEEKELNDKKRISRVS